MATQSDGEGISVFEGYTTSTQNSELSLPGDPRNTFLFKCEEEPLDPLEDYKGARSQSCRALLGCEYNELPPAETIPLIVAGVVGGLGNFSPIYQAISLSLANIKLHKAPDQAVSFNVQRSIHGAPDRPTATLLLSGQRLCRPEEIEAFKNLRKSSGLEDLVRWNKGERLGGITFGNVNQSYSLTIGTGFHSRMDEVMMKIASAGRERKDGYSVSIVDSRGSVVRMIRIVANQEKPTGRRVRVNTILPEKVPALSPIPVTE